MTDIERLYSESYPPSIFEPPDPPPVAPTITLLTPSSVSLLAMPPSVTITGTGFEAGLSVLVDGVASPSGAFVSPTSATFAPSATVPGTQQISVRVGTLTSNAAPLTVTATELGTTIVDVQAWVEEHRDLADEVLAEERAGAARVTLIDWLEGFIADRDRADPTP